MPANPIARRRREDLQADAATLLASMRASEVPGLPRHYTIRKSLQQLILSKVLKPGDQIPTEIEIMKIYSVSRITVRQAIGQLVATGALVAQSGRGTFVAQPRIQQDLTRLTGFVEDMDALGLKASAKVVSVKEIEADYYVAEKLKLKEGDWVTYIERIRYANKEPLSFDVTYLPIEIGRKIAKENLKVDPVFSLLEQKYGLKLSEADYAIEASFATSPIAKNLKIRKGAPILLIERNSYSIDGKPIDYEKLHYRGDRIRYKMLLKR